MKAREAAKHAECADCGLPYTDPGFCDLVIPDDAWRQIAPSGDGSGLLCPTCLCRALHRAGILTTGCFHSGPVISRALRAADTAPETQDE